MTDQSVVDWYLRICEGRSLGKDQRRRLWFAIAAEIERVQREIGDRDVAADELDAVCTRLRVPSLHKLVERVSAAPSIRKKTLPQAGGEPWPDDPRNVLAKHWPEIETLVAQMCAKHGADEEIAAAVSSRVKEKLWAGDFRIVRNFRQQSSFRTYLKTIVERTVLDVQTERLGKWHYSAAAERLGPLAKALERMIHQEGFEASEAIDSLLAWHPETTRTELEAMWQEIPARQPRPTRVEVDAAARSVPGNNPDIIDLSGERKKFSDTVTAVVQRFLDGLRDDDRLLLQLLMEEDLKPPAIATILQQPQKHVYRRRDQLLKTLRQELEKAGITRREAADLYDIIGRQSIFHFAKKEP